ncbi:MAG: hypothetical protein AAF598_13400 [Bacteroidota bacterium]
MRSAKIRSFPITGIYVRWKNEEQEKVLVSQLYGPAFDVELISTEILVNSGSIMRDYRLFETNDEGKSLTIQARIEDDNIFPFAVDEETGFLRFKMVWNEIREPDMQTTLTRGRQFQEIVEQDYQGQSISVAKFATTELIEFDHPEEGHREYEVHTFETFAQGIGLIHYRKEIVDGPTIEYQLADRIPMTELEKRFQSQLE